MAKNKETNLTPEVLNDRFFREFLHGEIQEFRAKFGGSKMDWYNRRLIPYRDGDFVLKDGRYIDSDDRPFLANYLEIKMATDHADVVFAIDTIRGMLGPRQRSRFCSARELPETVLLLIVDFLAQFGKDGFLERCEESARSAADKIKITAARIENAEKEAPFSKAQKQETLAKVAPADDGKMLHDSTVASPSFAQTLLGSLKSFEGICDTYLLYPRFSPQAFSLHLTFAAFYAFLGIAASWGIHEISGFGPVPILPTQDATLAEGDMRGSFDVEKSIQSRYFVLSVIAAVVMVFVIGALLATTKLGRDLTQNILSAIRGRQIVFAVAVSGSSALALYLSGMEEPFCALFAVMMSVSIVMSGRLQWKTLISAIYPVSFFLNIFLIAAIGALWGQSMSGAGGVLPVLSLLCLLIGALYGRGISANHKHSGTQENNAPIIAGAVTLISSLILAALNYYSFEGTWFLIEPWDPGTFLVFLVIPIANGFWDCISMSMTRKLTSSAIENTRKTPDAEAVRLYIAFVFMDIVIAFLTIVFLYITLYLGFELYNYISGKEASLDDYYRGFQEGLTTPHALLVIIMLVTVLMPTMLHVHMVGWALIRQSGWKAVIPSIVYVTSMVGAIALLLTIARGVLTLLYPIPIVEA